MVILHRIHDNFLHFLNRLSTRPLRVLLLCLATASICACTPLQKPVGRDYATVDPAPAWNACLQRCAQDDELGVRTRSGCRNGCTLAYTEAPLRGDLFVDSESCVLEMSELDLGTLEQELTSTCRSQTRHLYKRKGCTDAVSIFVSKWNSSLCIIKGDETTPTEPMPQY